MIIYVCMVDSSGSRIVVGDSSLSSCKRKWRVPHFFFRRKHGQTWSSQVSLLLQLTSFPTTSGSSASLNPPDGVFLCFWFACLLISFDHGVVRVANKGGQKSRNFMLGNACCLLMATHSPAPWDAENMPW